MHKTFARLTLKSNLMDPEEIKRELPILAEIYKAGDIIETKYSSSIKTQKSNRWVYSLESFENENINSVIKRIYRDVAPYKAKFIEYTHKFHAMLDIVVYYDLEKITISHNTSLTKTSLNILSELNVKLNISIFDW